MEVVSPWVLPTIIMAMIYAVGLVTGYMIGAAGRKTK